MPYSADDLSRIDVLEHIRSHPENYLGYKNVCVELLISRLVLDVLARDAAVTCVRESAWWFIASERSWLPEMSDAEYSEHFRAIVPFAEAGQNAFHGEVLVTAFARDVVVYAQGRRLQIAGSKAPIQLPDSIPQLQTPSSLAIAFRM